MRIPRKKCIATEAALFLACLGMAATVLAAPAGVVTQVSGPLFTQSGEGRIKALSADSEVSPGDVVVTARETFASVRLGDGAVLTLGPDARIAIVAYAYDDANSAGDRSELRLEAGSVRVAPAA